MCAKISPKGLRWFVWSIFFVLLLTIALSWGFYPEKYEFFQEAVSFLGGRYSYDLNILNYPSYVIFSIGFVIMGIIAIITSVIYFINMKRFKFAMLKGVLLFILGLGSAFTGVPWDVAPLVHGFGAFLFIAGVAVVNFVFQVLRYHKRHVAKPTTGKRAWDYYWDITFVVILFVTGTFYLVVQIWGWIPGTTQLISTALAQKVVLFAACIAILLLDVDDVK